MPQRPPMKSHNQKTNGKEKDLRLWVFTTTVAHQWEWGCLRIALCSRFFLTLGQYIVALLGMEPGFLGATCHAGVI